MFRHLATRNLLFTSSHELTDFSFAELADQSILPPKVRQSTSLELAHSLPRRRCRSERPPRVTTLKHLVDTHGTGRIKLLSALKELGVSKLADRQALASAVAKAARGEEVALKKRPPPLCNLEQGFRDPGTKLAKGGPRARCRALRRRRLAELARPARLIS